MIPGGAGRAGTQELYLENEQARDAFVEDLGNASLEELRDAVERYEGQTSKFENIPECESVGIIVVRRPSWCRPHQPLTPLPPLSGGARWTP